MESVQMEESTSVYEPPPPKIIRNELIARQLHFFARPRKQPRPLLIVLRNGERLNAIIMDVSGTQVKVRCFEQIRLIDGNEIVGVYTTKA